MGQNYTTFQEGRGMDDFDRLRFYLEKAGRVNPVHIITMSRENYDETRMEKIGKINGVKAVRPLIETCNIIVYGNRKKAMAVAEQVFRKVPEPIGIVRYEQQNMMLLYLVLKEAIDVARANGRMIHFFDPDKDSLEAMTERELAA